MDLQRLFSSLWGDRRRNQSFGDPQHIVGGTLHAWIPGIWALNGTQDQSGTDQFRIKPSELQYPSGLPKSSFLVLGSLFEAEVSRVVTCQGLAALRLLGAECVVGQRCCQLDLLWGP